MSQPSELKPIWPDAPRYCPDRELPPYRYVNGLHPHPTRDPEGHSFGVEHTPTYAPAERWRKNADYLFGIDLYHQGFLWESHEMWEGLWHGTDQSKPDWRLYRALIKNSAALIKAHEGAWDGVARHSKDARDYLETVRKSAETFMGLDLNRTNSALEACYGELWTQGRIGVLGRPPRFVLEW